jgi:hypothetical protein
MFSVGLNSPWATPSRRTNGIERYEPSGIVFVIVSFVTADATSGLDAIRTTPKNQL